MKRDVIPPTLAASVVVDLPERVLQEIERRRFAEPSEPTGQWMRDMEAIARLAAQEAAEICVGKVLDKQNPFDNGCADCAEAIRRAFGLEGK